MVTVTVMEVVPDTMYSVDSLDHTLQSHPLQTSKSSCIFGTDLTDVKQNFSDKLLLNKLDSDFYCEGN